MNINHPVKSDLSEIVELIQGISRSEIALPDYYTLSVFIELYGDISYVKRDERGAIMAISLNCPISMQGKGVQLYLFAVESLRSGQGIGKQFFSEVKSELSSKGLEIMQLRVLSENAVAYEFWKSVGFREYGRCQDNEGPMEIKMMSQL